MSLENAQAFVEELATNTELLARVEAATDNESKLAIAKEVGYSFSVLEMNQLIEISQRELSEEELELVAGGINVGLRKQPASHDPKMGEIFQFGGAAIARG